MAAVGPLPRTGLPSSAGHVLFWPCPHPQAGHTLGARLAGSPALEQEQQCLVRTQNDHLGGDLSSLASSEDFFASLENEHLWASVSSLFYSTTNCPQNFWTDCLHCYLKVQVQLMLMETKCHGSVKTNKNQQHRSRIRNHDTWEKLKRADIKKAGVATAQGLANLRFAESKIGRQPQRHRIIVITIVFFLYNMHKE